MNVATDVRSVCGGITMRQEHAAVTLKALERSSSFCSHRVDGCHLSCESSRYYDLDTATYGRFCGISGCLIAAFMTRDTPASARELLIASPRQSVQCKSTKPSELLDVCTEKTTLNPPLWLDVHMQNGEYPTKSTTCAGRSRPSPPCLRLARLG